jgi:hypothetical protein
VSQHLFYLSVKSTVDALTAQIAAEAASVYPDIQALLQPLDTSAAGAQVATGDGPALVWSLQQFAPSPRDPLYQILFMIGVRTTSDPNGETLANLLSVVQAELPIGFRFDIKNYSGETVSEEPGETGTAYVRGISVQEQLYDGQAAMRMISVAAAVVRDI